MAAEDREEKANMPSLSSSSIASARQTDRAGARPPFRLPHEGIRSLLPELPRGAITEILGHCSSGRTALMQMMVAAATAAGEVTAVIDFANAFDPQSAQAAGADLSKLLWVRASGRIEHAMRSADLILHAGGFGLVVLDLCDATPETLQHVPVSYWHRFRGAVEKTPALLLVAARESQARSCAARQIELFQRQICWEGTWPRLHGLDLQMGLRKPPGQPPQTVFAMAA
jgi:hypothetical protein